MQLFPIIKRRRPGKTILKTTEKKWLFVKSATNGTIIPAYQQDVDELEDKEGTVTSANHELIHYT